MIRQELCKPPGKEAIFIFSQKQHGLNSEDISEVFEYLETAGNVFIKTTKKASHSTIFQMKLLKI